MFVGKNIKVQKTGKIKSPIIFSFREKHYFYFGAFSQIFFYMNITDTFLTQVGSQCTYCVVTCFFFFNIFHVQRLHINNTVRSF